MKTVRIITPEGGSSFGTKILMEDGQEVQGVTGIQIGIYPESWNIAEISLQVGRCDIHAHALLSLDSLKEAADLHGYELTLKPDNQG